MRLHSDLQNKHKVAVIGRQKTETLTLKCYHHQQLSDCTQHWDRKLTLLKEESELALKKMAVEHRHLLKLEKHRLDATLDRTPKPTTEMLDMTRSLSSAKRHHRLEDAKLLKQRLKSLQTAAQKEWDRLRYEEIQAKFEHLKQQLDRALDSYKARLEVGLQELVLKKHRELDFLQKRYLNTLAEVNSSQRLELRQQR
jgi:hypothetical protein